MKKFLNEIEESALHCISFHLLMHTILNPQKKRNPKAKPEVSKTLSSIVFDSDDETFTKKGMRKLKEKRRRKKKQDKKAEEDADEEMLSTTENMQEKNTSATTKISKTGKQDNEGDTEIQSDLSTPKVNRSNKRKDITAEEDKEIIPKKKRKKTKENVGEKDESLASSSLLSEETQKKKRKRNRKKKNNSKKNKYAHLALNRKIEVAEGCAEGKFDMSGKKCESPLTPIEASQIYEQANKKSKVDSGIKIEKVTNVLKESSETQERMNFVTNSSNTVKSTKSGSEAVLNVNVNKAGKKKKQKLGLASDKAESPDSVSVSPEIKKNKRKGDPVSTPEQKKKAKKIPESGKQNSNDIVSSQVKKKKRDKTEKRIKNGAENTEVQDAKNEINNVKDIKMFDPQKLLELQQRQKKLLQALERSGRDNENKDSSNMKEKKKKNKFKSSEIVTSKNQLHNTKSSIANVNKVEKSARTKSDLTHQTNKTSLKSQSQKNSDPGNSSSKKQSMWGEKASAMSSLAQEKLNAAR